MQFKIIKDGEEHEFDDKEEWQNICELYDENDVDYQAEGPDEIDDGDAEPEAAPGERREMECDEHGETTHELYHSGDWLCLECEQSDDTDDSEEPEAMTNGGSENGTNPPTQVVEEPQTDTEDTQLPDRDLTDDPIDWMQQGSGEFTTTIKGTTVITKKGFRVLQHKYDISTGSEIVVGPEETDHEFCRVKAWAEMPDGRRAEAHASAHVDRGDDHYLLTSMADTRAKSRALSDVTGVGAVAVEEMAGVEK